MSQGPTTGAIDHATWEARPVQALVVRSLFVLVPLVASLGVVRLAAPGLWHPAGWLGAAVFVAQIAVIGSSAGVLTERATRRLLPLAVLLNMTLIFPDQAPSRFGLALRSGSLGRLRGAVADGETLDRQQAAELVVAMVAELGRHDRLTRGHTERVRAYADLIGQELDLPAQDRQFLSWAALIHDVGKLAVPAEILSLPDRPDQQQWRRLQSHPEAAAEFVEPLSEWLGEWRLAATEHHERWDGDGYPAGLAGTDISLAGRIVAVADAYDVITSRRSYKSAMSHGAAREELVRCSGSQFDPRIVRAFLQASLSGRTSRFSRFGWLAEVLTAALPRGVGQAVAATGSTAAIAVGVLTTGPLLLVADERVEASSAVSPDAPDMLAFGWVEDGTVDTATTEITAESGRPSTTATTPETIEAGDPTTSSTEQPTSSTSPATTSATATTTTTTVPTTTTTTATTTTTTTTAPTTTTTAASTTTTSPPIGTVYYLKNPGTGDSSSQLFKTLATGGVDDTLQPNFDTNRDSVAGLSLAPTGSGWAETDLEQIQRFGLDPVGADLDGPARVTLYAGADADVGGSPVTLRVSLNDCDSFYQNCTLLAEGSVSVSNSVPDDGFQQFVVDLGSVNHTFGGLRRMVLILIAEGGETLHTAFDAEPNPAVLDVSWD